MSVLPNEPTGKYMDTGAIMREYGFKRNAALALVRQLPKTEIPGHRKSFVKRVDVERLLAENTHDVVTAGARRRREAA